MQTINKIDDKDSFKDVYFAIGKCINDFAGISKNIPKVMLKIVQNIYGRFEESRCLIHRATREHDVLKKLEYLNMAYGLTVEQQSSFQSLVDGEGCTVGQAHLVIEGLHDIYKQIGKWKSYLINEQQ